MQLLDKAAPCWEKWKASFLAAFEISAVKRLDAALGYQYASGPPLEYVLEKRNLLHATEPRLASTADLALVMQGICLDIRNEVQMRALRTLDELFQCLQNLLTGTELEQEGSVWRRQLVFNNQDVNKLSNHKTIRSAYRRIAMHLTTCTVWATQWAQFYIRSHHDNRIIKGTTSLDITAIH